MRKQTHDSLLLMLTQLDPDEESHDHDDDDDDHHENGPTLSSRRALGRLRLLSLTPLPNPDHDLANALLRLLRRGGHVALDVLDHFSLVRNHLRKVLEDSLHLVHFRRQGEDILMALTNQHVVVLQVGIARVHSTRKEERGRSLIKLVLHLLRVQIRRAATFDATHAMRTRRAEEDSFECTLPLYR